ncbi:reverse transcriptase domain-containing protein [Tanacetum coccineum]
MSASNEAISAVLMTKRGTVQTPVYFVSRALQGLELNYTPMEKLVLSLVFSAKRLQGYFQEHPIAVIIDQLIKQIISCPNVILEDFHVDKSDKNAPDTSVVETPQEPWTLFTDGSSSVDGSGAGLILTSPEGTEFTYALRTYVLVEILKEKSIQEEEVATVVEEEGPTWMTLIMEYLKDGTLPGDRKEVSKLCIKARQYELLEGVLYKRSFLKPWLRCVGPLQADYVIREIHEGSCSMHAEPRSVVAKAMRLGYYWPTMHQDAWDMIRTCNDCQIHRPVPRNPQQTLTPITAP